MKKIFMSRGMGKTTQMINYVNGKGIYIVCNNKQRVSDLWKYILDNKLNIPMPITIDEVIGNNNKVFIDDVDLIISNLKKDMFFEFNGTNIEVDIDKTLVYKYLKMGCDVEGYTMNV